MDPKESKLELCNEIYLALVNLNNDKSIELPEIEKLLKDTLLKEQNNMYSNSLCYLPKNSEFKTEMEKEFTKNKSCIYLLEKINEYFIELSDRVENNIRIISRDVLAKVKELRKNKIGDTILKINEKYSPIYNLKFRIYIIPCMVHFSVFMNGVNFDIGSTQSKNNEKILMELLDKHNISYDYEVYENWK